MQSIESTIKQTTCKICNSALETKPIIQLSCTHKFHKDCFVSVFTKMPIADMHPYILKTKKCPECDKIILNSDCPELQKECEEVSKVYNQIIKDARKRFVIKDFKPNPEFKWESLAEKEQENFITTKAFYAKCHKCFNPYFVKIMPSESEIINSSLTPENYLCICCSNIGVTKCPTHGEEHIKHKCFFCCRAATFVCMNGTFWSCDAHHDINAIPEPRCFDPRKCPLGVCHPQNGDRTVFSLGCWQCRTIAKLE